jgi:hypothetical protein
MVDAGGHVVATVFAAIVGASGGSGGGGGGAGGGSSAGGGSGGEGGFAVPNALVRAQLAAGAARHGTVSTEGCTS